MQAHRVQGSKSFYNTHYNQNHGLLHPSSFQPRRIFLPFPWNTASHAHQLPGRETQRLSVEKAGKDPE